MLFVFAIKLLSYILGIGLLSLTLLLFLEFLASTGAKAAGGISFKLFKEENRSNLKIAVLVPAHDEELAIESTIQSIQSCLKLEDKLIVIADNCSDATAEIARALGALVIERRDVNNRGKGYALDYGLQYLDADPPDVIISIDADCQVKPGSIQYLAEVAASKNLPVQASYLFKLPEQPALKQRITVFGTKLRNLVRPLGTARFGLPCFLFGSGMAFPWSIIRSANIANSNLVEDIKLGLDLAIAGYPPIFCPEAEVTSYLPSQEQAVKGQKTRWEHGHLQLITSYFLPLMKESWQQRSFPLGMLALDLAIPPMALFVLVWLAYGIFSVGVFVLLNWWTPLLVSLFSGFLLVVSILGSWVKVGREELPSIFLAAIPFYVIWKVPVFLQFLLKPQKDWVRTQRN